MTNLWNKIMKIENKCISHLCISPIIFESQIPKTPQFKALDQWFWLLGFEATIVLHFFRLRLYSNMARNVNDFKQPNIHTFAFISTSTSNMPSRIAFLFIATPTTLLFDRTYSHMFSTTVPFHQFLPFISEC